MRLDAGRTGPGPLSMLICLLMLTLADSFYIQVLHPEQQVTARINQPTIKKYSCFPWIFNPGCYLNKLVNWEWACRTNTLGWEQCDVLKEQKHQTTFAPGSQDIRETSLETEKVVEQITEAGTSTDYQSHFSELDEDATYDQNMEAQQPLWSAEAHQDAVELEPTLSEMRNLTESEPHTESDHSEENEDLAEMNITEEHIPQLEVDVLETELAQETSLTEDGDTKAEDPLESNEAPLETSGETLTEEQEFQETLGLDETDMKLAASNMNDQTGISASSDEIRNEWVDRRENSEQEENPKSVVLSVAETADDKDTLPEDSREIILEDKTSEEVDNQEAEASSHKDIIPEKTREAEPVLEVDAYSQEDTLTEDNREVKPVLEDETPEKEASLPKDNQETEPVLEVEVSSQEDTLSEDAREAEPVLEVDAFSQEDTIPEDAREAEPILEVDASSQEDTLPEDAREAEPVLEIDSSSQEDIILEDNREADPSSQEHMLPEDSREAEPVFEAEVSGRVDMLSKDNREAEPILEADVFNQEDMFPEETREAKPIFDPDTDGVMQYKGNLP